jgi:hypothetical protein
MIDCPIDQPLRVKDGARRQALVNGAVQSGH